MSIIKRNTIRICVALTSLLISSVIFYSIVYILNYDLLNSSPTSTQPKEKILIGGFSEKYIKCSEGLSYDEARECMYPSEKDTLKKAYNNIIDTNLLSVFFNSDTLLIKIIYASLLLLLAFQIYICISYHFMNVDFMQMKHLSDWNVNVPPMLGVLGTIVSLSLTLSINGLSGFTDASLNSFYDATRTTIIGGVVYIINYFLLSFIIMNND